MLYLFWTGAGADAGGLLPKDKNTEENKPGEAHGVPEPCGCVHSDLPRFNPLEPGQGNKAEGERGDADKQVGAVQAGDQIKEVACRSGGSVKGEALGGKLAPGCPLTEQEGEAKGERDADPGQGAAQSRSAEAQPFFKYIEFTKDMPARHLH